MPERSELNYGTYLMVDELLELQRPRSQPEHPDELLFIVVHQASELWFKVILHELQNLIDHLQAAETVSALHTMRRVNALVRIVSGQLAALDTLPPQRFAQFRGHLGSSSGGQSMQFRAIEAMSGLRDEHFLTCVLALFRRHAERRQEAVNDGRVAVVKGAPGDPVALLAARQDVDIRHAAFPCRDRSQNAGGVHWLSIVLSVHADRDSSGKPKAGF